MPQSDDDLLDSFLSGPTTNRSAPPPGVVFATPPTGAAHGEDDDDKLLHSFLKPEPVAPYVPNGSTKPASEPLRIEPGPEGPTPTSSFMPAGTGLMDIGSFDPAEERATARKQGDLVQKAANGATLGFAPRLGALADSDPLGRALGTAPASTPTYDQALTARRGEQDRISREMPVGAKVAEGVGGMLGVAAPGLPMLNAARSASMVGRVGTGAVTGGAIGGVQSASDSKDLTNLRETGGAALKGAGVGASFGAGLPIAGGLFGAGYRAAAPFFARDPTGERSRIVSALLTPSATPETIARLESLGPHGMLADAAPSTLGLAQGVAAKGGPSADALVNALTARNAGQSDRLLHSLDENLGPAFSPRQAGGMMDARRAATSPMYEDALGNAPHVDISPVIQQFENARLYAKGTDAARLDRMRTLLDGPQRVGGAAMPEYDARALHRAKTEMDAQIEGVHNQTGSAAATATRDMVGVRSALNDALEHQVPGYREANLAYATAARGSEAFDAGRQALKAGANTLWPQDLAHEFAALPIERQALYRAGARSDIEAGLGNNRNDLSALNKTLGGENDFNRPKMATLFGEDQAGNVVRDVNRERRFADTQNKVVDNSQSAQRIKNADAIDVAAAPPQFYFPKGATLTGLAGHTGEFLTRKAFGAFARASGDATRDQLARALIQVPEQATPNLQSLIAALRDRQATSQSMSDALAHRSALVGALYGYRSARQ